MNRTVKRGIFVLAPILLAWGLMHLYRVATFKVHASSPSGRFVVYGLPFQGVNPHRWMAA